MPPYRHQILTKGEDSSSFVFLVFKQRKLGVFSGHLWGEACVSALSLRSASCAVIRVWEHRRHRACFPQSTSSGRVVPQFHPTVPSPPPPPQRLSTSIYILITPTHFTIPSIPITSSSITITSTYFITIYFTATFIISLLRRLIV